MNDRVLVFKTKKTLSHQVDRNVKLVTHATGGSEGVVDKAEMVKKKKVRNDARDRGQRLGNRVDTSTRRGTRDEGLIFCEKRLDFFTAVGKSLWEEEVVNKGVVEGGAGRVGERKQRAVGLREVTTSPEVNGRRIAMVRNKLTFIEANSG